MWTVAVLWRNGSGDTQRQETVHLAGECLLIHYSLYYDDRSAMLVRNVTFRSFTTWFDPKSSKLTVLLFNRKYIYLSLFWLWLDDAGIGRRSVTILLILGLI